MYNKLFAKMLDSSIWLEPVSTRIVWITLLAAMDEDGYAHFSAPENLSNRARVSLEETQAALESLMAPDKNSGDPDNDGRRIERVPGGYIVLNAKKYRGIMNRVVQKEQVRLRVAKHRESKKAGTVTSNKNSVTMRLPEVTSASASASVSEYPTQQNKKTQLSSAQLVVHDKELDRLNAEYKQIINSYDSHQDPSPKDAARLRELNVLRKELHEKLGVQV